MKIEQIYTGCLAQGAYYVTSGSEAIIIDPLREITPYTSRAQADGVTIKYILETHFHADFVSGHLDLAKATGAPIVFGPMADPQFAFHSAKDGELLAFGDCSVRVLHTPGHTMESTCYLLIDENGSEHALFSGDTLFIGDVGRPDLAQKSAAMTQEELAGLLYDSLRSKIMTLPDSVTVYPAHGAGSACGKNMSKETFDTLGNQKMVNYALRSDMDRIDFIKELTNGLLPPPSYFGMNVAMNKKGYDSIHDVMARGLKPLSQDQFTSLAPEALILDTRPATEFAQGFIPGSIFIGLEGQFAPWVGALIPDIKQEIILVTPDGKEEETVRRLARVGYDNVRGYLDGGIRAWEGTLDSIGRVEASDVEQGLTANERLIDVRKPGEYESEHLVDVPSIPLDFINECMAEFPKDKELVLLCGGGYRSMIAASILKSRGFEGIKDVIGGYAALAKTNLPKVTVACASTQS
jgi:glyoxylase-like metal-dependent hydrolase (beta-lactamase superfamily II)/rhodanese-related sulfurtransferase